MIYWRVLVFEDAPASGKCKSSFRTYRESTASEIVKSLESCQQNDGYCDYCSPTPA